MGVLKASVPLFIDVTGKKLVEETIRTHRGVADAIEARNPTAAHDAMYLHLVYNRNMIAESAQASRYSFATAITADTMRVSFRYVKNMMCHINN